MKHQRSHHEDIAQALDHAQLALAGNLLEDALRHVRAALELDPDHAEARVLEARIRLRRHEPRLALTALDNRDHIAEPNPDMNAPARPDVTMLRATALAAKGKIDLAVTLMESLAKDFPDDAGVLRALAGMQIKDDRKDDAAQTLERVTKLEPQDHAARRLRADMLAETDPVAALEALGKIDANNRGRAARLCRKSDRLAEAEMHYEKLLDTLNAEGTPDAELRREAADVAETMGENHKALDRLAGVIELGQLSDADAAEAWRRTGRLHLNAGRWGESAQAYLNATRRCEDDAEAWAGLVTCAHVAGRKRLMNRADHKLRALTPREERRNLLAKLYPHMVGAPDQVVSEAAQAHSPLQRMLADASVVMRKTAAKFPNRADVHYHRAVCDVSRGETAEAGQWVQKALTINPNYAAAQALAERVGVSATGETDNALFPFEEGI
ncbi:MAG: tetratricopeptide repeat protein [Planctomycetota bacterium]